MHTHTKPQLSLCNHVDFIVGRLRIAGFTPIAADWNEENKTQANDCVSTCLDVSMLKLFNTAESRILIYFKASFSALSAV